MLDIYGYLTSWGIYLAAGTLCYVLFHLATRARRWKTLSYSARAFMIALIYTPWYVAEDQDLMAPAVIVILLDMITAGANAFIRALVPLTLAIICALLIAMAWRTIDAMGRKKP